MRAILSSRHGWNCCVFHILLVWISPSQSGSINPTALLLDYCCCYISQSQDCLISWVPPCPPPPPPFVFPWHITVLPLSRLRAVHVSGGDLLESKPWWVTAGLGLHVAAVTFKSSEHIKEVEQWWRRKLNFSTSSVWSTNQKWLYFQNRKKARKPEYA